MSYILSTDDGRLLESNIIFKKRYLKLEKVWENLHILLKVIQLLNQMEKQRTGTVQRIKTEEILKLQNGKRSIL